MDCFLSYEISLSPWKPEEFQDKTSFKHVIFTYFLKNIYLQNIYISKNTYVHSLWVLQQNTPRVGPLLVLALTAWLGTQEPWVIMLLLFESRLDKQNEKGMCAFEWLLYGAGKWGLSNQLLSMAVTFSHWVVSPLIPKALYLPSSFVGENSNFHLL